MSDLSTDRAHATDELALELDRAKQQAGGCPCLRALHGGAAVVVNDLESAGRTSRLGRSSWDPVGGDLPALHGDDVDLFGVLTLIGPRDLIGQAEGMLMERHRITTERADDMLQEASMRQHVEVRELARGGHRLR